MQSGWFNPALVRWLVFFLREHSKKKTRHQGENLGFKSKRTGSYSHLVKWMAPKSTTDLQQSPSAKFFYLYIFLWALTATRIKYTIHERHIKNTYVLKNFPTRLKNLTHRESQASTSSVLSSQKFTMVCNRFQEEPHFQRKPLWKNLALQGLKVYGTSLIQLLWPMRSLHRGSTNNFPFRLLLK